MEFRSGKDDVVRRAACGSCGVGSCKSGASPPGRAPVGCQGVGVLYRLVYSAALPRDLLVGAFTWRKSISGECSPTTVTWTWAVWVGGTAVAAASPTVVFGIWIGDYKGTRKSFHGREVPDFNARTGSICLGHKGDECHPNQRTWLTPPVDRSRLVSHRKKSARTHQRSSSECECSGPVPRVGVGQHEWVVERQERRGTNNE
jgi:hypothetical protein